MATPNQIRANRANALRSTGPVTPKGKQIASRNSIRHGMVSQTVVLEGESQDRFIDLLTSLTAQLKPRSDAEAAIIETMAIARWKQMRIWGIQKAGFDLEMQRLVSSCTLPAARAAMVFKSLADNSRVLDLQHRYETGYDRQFCRAYAFYLKLREKPVTQLEDTEFPSTQFSSATATWEPAPEPTPDDPPTPDHQPDQRPQEAPSETVDDQKENEEENPNQLRSETTQTAALVSPKPVLRNGPNSSPLFLGKTPPTASASLKSASLKATPPTRKP
jgi:hypothetical protein